MSDDKELPVFITECQEENARLKERIAELEANNARLREALEGLLNDGCWVGDEWVASDYAVTAADAVLAAIPADSLAAVRREAMEEARERLINVVENFWNLVDDSDPRDMVRAMRETEFYGVD